MENNVIGNFIRRKSALILSALLIFSVIACGTNRAIENNSREQRVQELVEKREFEIENNWLMPLGGNRINLLGNPNYIRMKGDSIDIFLPYFGVRHAGGGYGTEGAIEYKGLAEDFDATYNENRNSYTMKFAANHELEYYNFIIVLFSNGETSTSVNSTQRNSVSYRGELLPLEEDFFK